MNSENCVRGFKNVEKRIHKCVIFLYAYKFLIRQKLAFEY